MVERGKGDLGMNEKKPNIVFFLVDDMGWMDTTVNGSQYYETPNMERLAERGMVFTQSYSANPFCSPTRASIMTGKYPARLGMTMPSCHMPEVPYEHKLAERAEPWKKVVDVHPANVRRYLPLDEYTIGESLKDAGYRTGFIGKWHLGRDEKYWPRNRGFDLDLCAPNAWPPSYFSPYQLDNISDGPDGEYITDRLTDEALKFMDDCKDEPFFLCLWHFAVHSPFQGKEELVKKYEAKVDPRGKQDCAVMGAMIESMDDSLGRVIDKLDELGIADNTVIIFVSDNGGDMYDRVDGKPPTNNYPLRGGKGNVYEGGIRVPCIISWPGVVKPGSVCPEMFSSIDFYPTLLDMAGSKKNEKQLIDGESIMPLLTGAGKLKRDVIFCHMPHYLANPPHEHNLPVTSVRRGDWKLIRYYGEGENFSHAYELFNLAEDLNETKNLAKEMPEKVRELDALITEHLEEIGALVPSPNPDYDPKAESKWQLKKLQQELDDIID